MGGKFGNQNFAARSARGILGEAHTEKSFMTFRRQIFEKALTPNMTHVRN